MSLALGCDVSHWQGRIDFEKMREAGASFVFIKASQGTWTDRKFDENYMLAKRAGLIVGEYHYLDWSAPAGQQARHFASLVREYPPDIEPVVDYEERTNAPNRLAAPLALSVFVKTVKEAVNRTCMIYTSPGYWKEYGDASARWQEHPLWIAHYGVNKPAVPKPWSGWLFWQYTDRGDGSKFGVESKQVDLNWFNGTVEELRRRYSASEGVPTEQNDSAAAGGPRLKVVVPTLNVRLGPAVSSAKIGELKNGAETIVEAIKVESPNRVWVKHHTGWSALVYDGQVMMREVR